MLNNGFDAKQITGILVVIPLVLVCVIFGFFYIDVLIFIVNNFLLFIVLCVLIAIISGVVAHKIEFILNTVDSEGKIPDRNFFVYLVLKVDSIIHGPRL